MNEPLPPLPTMADVRRAASVIAPYLSLPTPLLYSPGLSELLEARVSLKLECATPINAFKVRGGLYLLSTLAPEHRRAGVVTASTGNHGQSIAYAAQLLGVPATIFVPEVVNPDKQAAIQRFGAEIARHGAGYDNARLAAIEYAAERGMRYLDAVNTPELYAGVGTAALEVLAQQQPETDLVIVPVGGGSEVCGWIIVRDGLGAPTEVWATQSAQAPAVHDSWRAGRLLARPNTTFAEGLATGQAFALPLLLLQPGLSDFVLVDDREIAAAVVVLLQRAHILAEPAGACSTAAALARRDRIRGRRVVLVVSGSNITLALLRQILNDAAVPAAER